jgi:hypothetical protein
MWTDEPLRCGGPLRTAAPWAREDFSSAYEFSRENEEFFTLFSEAGSNIVESVAIPWRHAPGP